MKTLNPTPAVPHELFEKMCPVSASFQACHFGFSRSSQHMCPGTDQAWEGDAAGQAAPAAGAGIKLTSKSALRLPTSRRSEWATLAMGDTATGRRATPLVRGGPVRGLLSLGGDVVPPGDCMGENDCAGDPL